MTRFSSIAAALPAAVTLLAPTVYADSNGAQGSGVVSFPLTARHGAPLMEGGSSKRQLSSDATGRMSGTIYTIDVTLGTPGDLVPVQFDTGSTDFAVNPACSSSGNPGFCYNQPRFTKSNSIVDLGVYGESRYEGGGYAKFLYIADYVGIGSARVTQQIFGIIYNSGGITNGVLGAAPDTSGWTNSFPLVIDSLLNQALIQSQTFSLDLRGLAAGGESKSLPLLCGRPN